MTMLSLVVATLILPFAFKYFVVRPAAWIDRRIKGGQ